MSTQPLKPSTSTLTDIDRWKNDQVNPPKLTRAQLDALCERTQAAGMLNLQNIEP